MAPDNSILEIKSNNRRLVEYKQNDPFVVTDDESIEQDAFYSPSANLSEQRECTPTPPTLPFLRLTTANRPMDTSQGWVFGSQVKTSDIMLDIDVNQGVSARQFTVKLREEPGTFIVKNLSRHGTLMRHETTGYTRVKTQRAFSGKMDIHLGEYTVELICLGRGSDFERLWRQYYSELEVQLPPLTNLAMSAPSATNDSLEYELDQPVGQGQGGRVYRAIKRKTGEVFAVKKYKDSGHIREEVSILSKIQHV
jgi:hypothetical protein